MVTKTGGPMAAVPIPAGIALSEGPQFDDYLSGSGEFADQALRRLSDRLRERRGGVVGNG